MVANQADIVPGVLFIDEVGLFEEGPLVKEETKRGCSNSFWMFLKQVFGCACSAVYSF